MDQKKVYTIGSNLFEAPKIDPALYLVSTPIGNLKDISLRALETLSAVDYIACEDTRVSRVFFERYGILNKLISYHEHNAHIICSKIIHLLEQNHSIALISDAGTPLISDPGFRLVEDAQNKNLKIYALPGACAFLTALVASGLPPDSFAFLGFLPSKKNARIKKLEDAKHKNITTIFYESPQRLLATLEEALEVFGVNHEAVVARELTKKFEEVKRLPLEKLYEFYQKKESIKGEIVLLFAPFLKTKIYNRDEIDAMLKNALKNKPIRQISQEISGKTGLKKKDLYQRLLFLKDEKRE